MLSYNPFYNLCKVFVWYGANRFPFCSYTATTYYISVILFYQKHGTKFKLLSFIFRFNIWYFFFCIKNELSPLTIGFSAHNVGYSFEVKYFGIFNFLFEFWFCLPVFYFFGFNFQTSVFQNYVFDYNFAYLLLISIDFF